MSNLIKNIASCERPYEKAISNGVEFLSDAELFAIVLRNGTNNKSAIDLANDILNAHPLHKGLIGINYLTRNDLKKISGIGDTKATIILALAELSKRICLTGLKKEISYCSPEAIAGYYMEYCKYLSREKTFLLLLDTNNSLIKDIILSEGTINEAHMSPREIYYEALKYGAVNIVLLHNHPSGNASPSDTDIETTKKIVEAGRIIGIRLLDHIIIGNDSYYSMYERGIIVWEEIGEKT